MYFMYMYIVLYLFWAFSKKQTILFFFLSPMASSTAATASHKILLFNPILGNHHHPSRKARFFRTGITTNSCYNYNTLKVHASKESSRGPQKAPPGVDTRIHWENEDEGWIGGTKQRQSSAEEKPNNLFGENFSDLLEFEGSHYEWVTLYNI